MMGSGHYRNTKATEPIISLRWAFLLKVVENIRPHWLNYILTNRTLRLDAITQTWYLDTSVTNYASKLTSTKTSALSLIN